MTRAFLVTTAPRILALAAGGAAVGTLEVADRAVA